MVLAQPSLNLPVTRGCPYIQQVARSGPARSCIWGPDRQHDGKRIDTYPRRT